ncbi:DNA-processing protein DprA [uncultured Clostridium sp.]|uniref:DNA-processing protein DprA n=1 Tax=uncultured Clostridium sp. TaxID=59620 RepID=UPI0025FF1BA6|nr:DNA-processing protein DprA [uncultured Clostridium sp.]
MKFKIWLLMLNINDKNKLNLLKIYHNETEIYENLETILIEENIKINSKEIYDKKIALNKAEEILLYINKENIGFITINDKEYPEKLKEIEIPPYGLFYKGDINLLNTRTIAIVGSRLCTNYGIEVTKLLTKELNGYNITIVSGGAKGIDSVAHSTSVYEEGKTIVVLGCGIDVVYPYSNRFLFKDIEKSGLIISEFLPKVAPLKYNFPRRNRIISALSELVIVVEASEKSGSLITANYALEQGRNVMAIPGSIYSKASNGCNKLIRDGAQVFCSMEDLHTLLGVDCKEKGGIKSPIKQKILSIISDEPIHIDDIVNKSFIDREVLFNVLFDMQIRNEIISLPGNYYTKII